MIAEPLDWAPVAISADDADTAMNTTRLRVRACLATVRWQRTKAATTARRGSFDQAAGCNDGCMATDGATLA